MEIQRENLSIVEVVHRFGIGRTKLYQLIRTGEVEAFKLGRRTLVRTNSVQSFVDKLPRVGNIV